LWYIARALGIKNRPKQSGLFILYYIVTYFLIFFNSFFKKSCEIYKKVLILLYIFALCLEKRALLQEYRTEAISRRMVGDGAHDSPFIQCIFGSPQRRPLRLNKKAFLREEGGTLRGFPKRGFASLGDSRAA